jgi:hypothetical protein
VLEDEDIDTLISRLAASRRSPTSVKIPAGEDEAALMVLLGTNYLREHAAS